MKTTAHATSLPSPLSSWTLAWPQLTWWGSNLGSIRSELYKFSSSGHWQLLWPSQVWCILKNDGESAAASAASHQLTVCTYPEVRLFSRCSFQRLSKRKKPCSCSPPPALLRSLFWAVWSPWWPVQSSCVWTLCWSWRCCCWRWRSMPTSFTWPSSRSPVPTCCTGQSDLWSKTLFIGSHFLINVQIHCLELPGQPITICLKQTRCVLHTLTAFKGCPLTCPSPLSPC